MHGQQTRTRTCRRLQLKRELKEAVPEADSESAPSEAAEADSDAAEEAKEEALQGEMREVLDKAERRLKRERKRRREQRLKSRVRAAQMALSEPPCRSPFVMRCCLLACRLRGSNAVIISLNRSDESTTRRMILLDFRLARSGGCEMLSL